MMHSFKMDWGVAAELLSEYIKINNSYRLSNEYIVFYAKTLAIKE